MKKIIIAACMAMTLTTPITSVHASKVNEVSIAKVQVQQLYYKPSKYDQAYWGVVVNCREWISLRSEPYTSASRLARIPLGARVAIFDAAPYNGFYVVEYNGIIGYALAEYIRSTGEAT